MTKFDCTNCRHQLGGFDGGFDGEPFTCECRIFGVTENRKDCREWEKKPTIQGLLDENSALESSVRFFAKRCKELVKENRELKEENEQLRNMYHNLSRAIEKTCNDLGKEEDIYLGDFDICRRITEYEKELLDDE